MTASLSRRERRKQAQGAGLSPALPPPSILARAQLPLLPQLSPPSLPPGSLPLKLSPSGAEVIVTTSSGREIMLFPSVSGMEQLLKLLFIEAKRAKGGWRPEAELERRAEAQAQAQPLGPAPRQFDAKGRPRVTLASLGLL